MCILYGVHQNLACFISKQIYGGWKQFLRCLTGPILYIYFRVYLPTNAILPSNALAKMEDVVMRDDVSTLIMGDFNAMVSTSNNIGLLICLLAKISVGLF